MKKPKTGTDIIQYLLVFIGFALIVVGYLNDADIVTFLGVFLVMAPFLLCPYVKSKQI